MICLGRRDFGLCKSGQVILTGARRTNQYHVIHCMVSQHIISPILQKERICLSGFVGTFLQILYLLSISMKTFKLFNHSVTTDYSANSTLNLVESTLYSFGTGFKSFKLEQEI